MDKQTLDEVINVLGEDRRMFWYSPGQFASWLLLDAIGSGLSIRKLRELPVAPLLQRPKVKQLLSQAGDGYLTPNHLRTDWSMDAIALVVQLGSWGGFCDDDWYQTSRPGYNLVLRFDFTGEHVQQLKRLVGDYDWFFNYSGHPVTVDAKRVRETLAWVRLDFDLDHDEVLIEEIQSDWVRCAAWAAKHGWDIGSGNLKAAQIRTYVNYVLKPIQAIWTEAVLTGTLQFIRNELGIRRVFYHDPRTGAALKRIRYTHPPRSLYSDLPKKFCMQATDAIPSVLTQQARCRRVLKKIRPHRLFSYELNVGQGTCD